MADQGLSVGGTFLVSLVLARTQTKEEFGAFALCYSVFIFFSALHNAVVLEAYTVYGSGRHHRELPDYVRLISRANFQFGLLLTLVLVAVWGLTVWMAPNRPSGALLGLAIASGPLLTGAFLRRSFYIERKVLQSAKMSGLCSIFLACGLWLLNRFELLSGLSAFLLLGASWWLAGETLGRQVDGRGSADRFLEAQPRYWAEHWKYAKWVLATAAIFQLTTQGSYWIVAGLLSTKEVGELRAVHMLVLPVDQLLSVFFLLFIPALSSRFAASRIDEFISVWKRYALATILVTASLAVLLWAFGGQLSAFMYAGKFDNAADLIPLMALLPMVMGVGGTMNDGLKSAERPKYVFYAYLAGGGMTALMGVPLVANLGLRGAAYGMILSSLTYTLAMSVGFFHLVRSRERAVSFPPEPAGPVTPSEPLLK